MIFLRAETSLYSLILCSLGKWQGPTSRKEREKWGTQGIVNDF